MKEIKLSVLPKTWLFDLDGTLVKHNGHHEGEDIFLPGALELLKSIDREDKIIILTARSSEYFEKTFKKFEQVGIKIDHWIFDLPAGERIIFNDDKPGGMKTAIACCVWRDAGLDNIKIIEMKDY